MFLCQGVQSPEGMNFLTSPDDMQLNSSVTKTIFVLGRGGKLPQKILKLAEMNFLQQNSELSCYL